MSQIRSWPEIFCSCAILIVETKGNADLDTPLKMKRLQQWCEDVNKAQNDVEYDCVYVEQEDFEKYRPTSLEELKNLVS